jgi:hypothetical protein
MKSRIFGYTSIAILVSIFFYLGYYFCIVPVNTNVELTDYRWSRRIAIGHNELTTNPLNAINSMYPLIQNKTVNRYVEANGNDQNPNWPPFSLESDKEKVTDEYETYSVVFTLPNGTELSHQCKNEREWRKYKIGKRYSYTVNRIGIFLSQPKEK